MPIVAPRDHLSLTEQRQRSNGSKETPQVQSAENRETSLAMTARRGLSGK
jgi:hypothetical protein